MKAFNNCNDVIVESYLYDLWWFQQAKWVSVHRMLPWMGDNGDKVKAQSVAREHPATRPQLSPGPWSGPGLTLESGSAINTTKREEDSVSQVEVLLCSDLSDDSAMLILHRRFCDSPPLS